MRVTDGLVAQKRQHLSLGRLALAWIAGVAVLSCVTIFAVPASATPEGAPRYEEREIGGPTASPTCGAAWRVVESANVSGRPNALRGISAIADDDIWAVGYSGYLFQTPQTLTEHWDGSTWTRVSSPNVDGVGVLLGVSAVASNDVWAVGYSFSTSGVSVLVEHWDGSTWSVSPVPATPGTDSRLFAVSAVGPNDIWAVGYYTAVSGPSTGNSVTLTLHWDGASWSIVTTPNVGNVSNQLYGVHALSSNDAWAVGSVLNASLPLTLHWDGSTWAIVENPTTPMGDYRPNNLNAVDGVAANDIWAVGAYRSTDRSRTMIEHWDGSAWSMVTYPLPPDSVEDELYGISALASNDVWAVGSYSPGTLYSYAALVLHWDGATWSLFAGPDVELVDESLYGVDTVGSNSVWAVGVQGDVYQSNVQTLAAHYSDTCITPEPTNTPLPTDTPTPTVTPTPCTAGSFSDVPPDSTFYQFVTCLVNRGIISGYSDCTFRPGNAITRGQIAKMVSNAANIEDDPGPQIFEDVDPSNPFFTWINRLANHGFMGGYPCGGEGEPCNPPANLPYFRPVANATRGQLAKIVSNAAGVGGNPTGQFYADVLEDNPFYIWIMRLTQLGVMSGYPCGGEGEPCDGQNRPYFRPYNNVTRGQASKIVANTFFPNCQTRSIR
ncbi:MAG TPA: S-layer homology domain-containing protein [Chloroflexia bacterium]|nr:S-layer homology domain-containing protein [Chloroflexia bacterium]